MNSTAVNTFSTFVLYRGLAALFSIHATWAFACCDIETQLIEDSVDGIATYTTEVYDQLKVLGCNDSDRFETEACNGDVFKTWNNVRSLVHTANELSGTGSTEFSLGTGADGLVEALRWNAGEEYSSQETMSTRVASNQQSTLASRIAVLRSGASGFSVNGSPRSGSHALANNSQETGMNAGDELWSPWGGFINVSYGYGNLDPSAHEDAFDFDTQDINAGIDYRLNNQWTVGGLLAYAQENVDFDSSKSTVDGTVDMNGFALTAFLLFQSETWYYNLSGGYQTSEFDTERSVRYTSLNLDLPSPNTVAISNNKGHTLSASFSGGYTFQITDRFSVDPSVSANYQQLTINGFTERDQNNTGFNLQIDEQSFTSLETITAIKFQYVLSNRFGVFTPYIDLQSFSQQHPEARRINAVYANIADAVSEDAQMSLLTDKSETEYRSVGFGVASVLHGSSQKNIDSGASGGIQAFIAYRELSAAGNLHQKVISGGLRYEF